MDQNDLKLERALIGRRLRSARQLSGSTLEEVASGTGVQPLAVRKWEEGKTMPCLVQFRTLLGLYGATPCDVLFETNPFRMTRAEAAELLALAKNGSPALRSRVELLVSVLGEPRLGWAGEAAGAR